MRKLINEVAVCQYHVAKVTGANTFNGNFFAWLYRFCRCFCCTKGAGNAKHRIAGVQYHYFTGIVGVLYFQYLPANLYYFV